MSYFTPKVGSYLLGTDEDYEKEFRLKYKYLIHPTEEYIQKWLPSTIQYRNRWPFSFFDLWKKEGKLYDYMIITVIEHQWELLEKNLDQYNLRKYQIYKSPPVFNTVHPERTKASMLLYVFDLVEFRKDHSV